MTTMNLTDRRRRLLALGAAMLMIAPIAVGVALPIENVRAAGIMQPANAPLISYADIVAADKPAVVTITTKIKPQNDAPDMQSFDQQFGQNSPYNEFFRQFFGDQSPFGQMPQQQGGGQVAQALGSGFIVSSDGVIVTNNHVIDGASEITVTLDNGKDYKGKLLGHDPKTDLAVVKINASDLPTVQWGDSDKMRAGDAVLAIGNPFGIGTTVTSGIVSARGRDLHNGPYDDFIQVDAPINHGNSGGPLVDASGKVIGINTAIYSPNGGNVGVGFAIPSDQAQGVVAKLAAGETIEHGYIGVQIQPVTQDIAEALGIKDGEGAMVAQVVDGSPAAKAGLRSGDVVTQFDGKAVASPKDLSRLVADTAPGRNADLAVWRHGKSVDLTVAVGKNSNEQQASASGQGQVQPGSGKVTAPDIGVTLSELTPSVRQRNNLDDNVQGAMVASVDPDKPAGQVGLQPGDVIVSVNQQETTSARAVADDVETAQKDGRKSVLLEIERGDNHLFVGVPFGAA